MQASVSPGALPYRKRLPHEIPGWVPDGARYFVTINCKERGVNALAHSDAAGALIEGLMVYRERDRWYPWLMVVMPDHVHMILSVNKEMGLGQTISAWKGYFARTLGIEWQSGFFEHRLRSDSEFDEKAAYVRLNPVRKGLVNRIEDWPHVWDLTRKEQSASKPLG